MQISDKQKYDKVIELSRRRGFLWRSFEIYGGTSGFWDYGPLGAALKRKIEEEWRKIYVIGEGFFEIETPTIGIKEVFVASGHVNNFVDVTVECTKCGAEYRADHLIRDATKPLVFEHGENGTFSHVLETNVEGLDVKELDKIIREDDIKCPSCGGELGECYQSNLMFKTSIGAGEKKVGYLRPETAQGIFVDFPHLLRFYREKLPFGIVQIGKAYRNEISPRQGVIRLREFTLAEAEIFIDYMDDTHPTFERVEGEKVVLYPREDQNNDEKEPKEMDIEEALNKKMIENEFLAYNIALAHKFLTKIGIPKEKIRFRQHKEEEMAHYASDCWDAEIETEQFGWIEVIGIADREDYDLKAHSTASGQDLTLFKSFENPIKTKKKLIKPKMGKIGPVFKEKTPSILKKLKEGKNEIKDGKISLEIDGEEITIGEEMYSLEEVEEEVYGEKIIPHVIEPSYGIDRILYALLEHSYREESLNLDTDLNLSDEKENEKRIVLGFNAFLAPIDVAVLPLLTKEGLIKKSRDVVETLKRENLLVDYDDSGSIGRRYRRQDEVGTPFCVTIDFETLEDDTVTIRERDTMKQIRVKKKYLPNVFRRLREGEEFKKMN